MENLNYYWHCIPVGKENAVTYTELCALWNCNARKVRLILSKLSNFEGDNMVLIRSSHGKGFYKTDNVSEINLYIRECTNRAKNIFVTLRKARRVLKELEV